MRNSHGWLGPLSGVLASVLFFVGFFLPGTPPKADDSVAEISSYLVDKRDSILTGDVLIGLGAVFLIAFGAALASHLTASIREDDHGLAGLIRSMVVVAATLLTAGVAVLNGVVFKSGGDAGIVRFAFDSGSALLIISGFAFGGFFAAVALANARSHAFASWMTTLAGVAALAQVLSCLALFTKSGFFANGGAMGIVAPLVGTVWVLSACVMMYRHHAPEATSPTAAPAT
jgi:hypothetical protein